MNPKNLSVEMADPTTLAPNPWNSNVVPPDNEAKLEESIKRFGMFKPVIVREIDGGLQIIGGEHRATAAIRLKMGSIPIINLGRISEKKAKEIGLIDNGRYGDDNVIQLAKVLEDIGTVEEIAEYMPYTTTDLTSIFSTVNIELDSLELPEEEDQLPSLPSTPKVQTHQIMRFKVPVDDANTISELIEKTMKTQKFTQGDSLENAGDALVFLLRQGK